MCFLSSRCGKVNKEIKSLTCEKLRISVPPRSSERGGEGESGEDEEEGALLGPAPGVPTGRSPPHPVSSGRCLASHACCLPPFSPPARIGEIISIDNSLAKQPACDSCSPPSTPVHSGIQWKRRLRSITRPRPAPSPVLAPQLPEQGPRGRAQTRRSGEGGGGQRPGGSLGGCTHARAHTCTRARSHTHLYARSHAQTLRKRRQRRSGGVGGKWVRSGAVTWSCCSPGLSSSSSSRSRRLPARPPPPPADPARLRSGRFNPSPAAAATTAATSGAPRCCCLALVLLSHSPAPGSGRESTRVRKSSIQKSQLPACLLLPAPPLLRSALLCSALLFFSFLRRRRLLLLLLPGALSVPELLLSFPSSSFSSSSSSSLSLFLPPPFALFFFFPLLFFLRLVQPILSLQIAVRSPTRAPSPLPPSPPEKVQCKQKRGKRTRRGGTGKAGENHEKPTQGAENTINSPRTPPRFSSRGRGRRGFSAGWRRRSLVLRVCCTGVWGCWLLFGLVGFLLILLRCEDHRSRMAPSGGESMLPRSVRGVWGGGWGGGDPGRAGAGGSHAQLKRHRTRTPARGRAVGGGGGDVTPCRPVGAPPAVRPQPHRPGEREHKRTLPLCSLSPPTNKLPCTARSKRSLSRFAPRDTPARAAFRVFIEATYQQCKFDVKHRMCLQV
ncbi:uncharacterized protein LOC115601039 [Strigops habroptila]|uniref:uncharacterized protein LOC115601039 n=1 Tax=Strigops habroptila TaxID=2489341 RepID=UPI0011CF56AF|nr:uncharacterized protein LOC115601039 [Strigops habroptila]